MENIHTEQQRPFVSLISRSSPAPEQTGTNANTLTSFANLSTSMHPTELSVVTIDYLPTHAFPIVLTPALTTFAPRVSLGTATIMSPPPASTRSTSVTSVEESEDAVIAESKSNSSPFKT
ncbi:hypothetical protein KIN20_014060 [Parelaphostrongylus tenuis]|uniref:Uncharacterized protein n=1 Tax=Parelaphostrongylus tenuis TaxID=148309 RepID=A0AAD5MHQ9_PARTN|nr:hypothetical protein KIN20_014060 [Parelaphostrongylus tenuis]